MTKQTELAEAIFLFEGNGIAEEMSYLEFEGLISGAVTMERFAASHVRCAYTVVGEGLSVQGVVLFLLEIDETGCADPAFNIPLRYMVRNAGRGPDVGNGRIRYAHRGQCPVPWHAVNLWLPSEDGDSDPVELIQRSVWRNKLGLKPSSGLPVPKRKVRTDVPLDVAAEIEATAQEAADRQKVLEAKLDDTFGQEGRVSLKQLIQHHNTQLSKLADKYRGDVAAQQQVYLEQIRQCKDELHKLKSSLRHEQERSRRLQQLLRGEVG